MLDGAGKCLGEWDFGVFADVAFAVVGEIYIDQGVMGVDWILIKGLNLFKIVPC